MSATGIEKSYGPVAALRGVDLVVHPGEVVVLFGPNGAGKSTLLRILATLTRPDYGAVTVGGFSCDTDGEQARRLVGTALHSTMLYGDLTVRENLRFFGSMFRIPEIDRRVDEVAAQLQIAPRLDDRVRTLSHGFSKRVALARALLHDPLLLLLDEADAGLDERAGGIFRDLVRDYRSRDRSVVMTTHDATRGLDMGDRAVVLAQGKVVLDTTCSAIDAADLARLLAGAAEAVA